MILKHVLSSTATSPNCTTTFVVPVWISVTTLLCILLPLVVGLRLKVVSTSVSPILRNTTTILMQLLLVLLLVVFIMTPTVTFVFV